MFEVAELFQQFAIAAAGIIGIVVVSLVVLLRCKKGEKK